MRIKNYRLKTRNLTKGQSLFEVVIAVAISSLIITAIVALASNSIQNSSYSRDKTIASGYIQETLEWLKQNKSQNPEEFRAYAINTSGADITYCLNELSWPVNPGSCSASETVGGKFDREIVIIPCDAACGEITDVNIIVSWVDAKGSHIVSSVTSMSSI